MQASVLDTITKLIQSPPGHLVAGGVLAGIVWKFFERVEAVLTDQTKLEIAVWLLGVKVGQKAEPWPETFARVFDQVFGTKHLSWKCFVRSIMATIACVSIFVLRYVQESQMTMYSNWFGRPIWIPVLHTILTANLLPDYISLLESRWMLRFMQQTDSPLWTASLIVLDFVLTSCISLLAVSTFAYASFVGGIKPNSFWKSAWSGFASVWSHPLIQIGGVFRSPISSGKMWLNVLFFYPAFFTSVWLWLYAGSGLLLKAARRFDVGFDWFNRKFDIEHKPLQSIGLVAGALVAVAYWSVVIVSRFGEMIPELRKQTEASQQRARNLEGNLYPVPLLSPLHQTHTPHIAFKGGQAVCWREVPFAASAEGLGTPAEELARSVPGRRARPRRPQGQ
jgi:hypothetical protein